MNAVDVLKYGNLTVLHTLDGVPISEWETGGVCGVWSVKDIIAHLASFEHMLVDLLNSFLDGGPTPCLDEYRELGVQFNDAQVALRQSKSPQEVLAEYKDTQAQVMELVKHIPQETIRQPGTLPWYGMEYDLEDFLVYTFYGHKREHCAQINVFRDQLGLTNP